MGRGHRADGAGATVFITPLAIVLTGIAGASRSASFTLSETKFGMLPATI